MIKMCTGPIGHLPCNIICYKTNEDKCHDVIFRNVMFIKTDRITARYIKF